MKEIKITIADDHDLFRSGLVELLRKQERFNVIANVSNGESLIASLETSTPDVILLDLSMPKMNGFQALEEISKSYSHIKVIIISMHDDGNYISKCAKNGAHGYLLKNADEEELIEAILHVSAGNKYYNPLITEKMINAMSSQGQTYKNLSKKEAEVIQFLKQGLTTKEIAAKLYVSTRTVETHRANMLKKLEAKNTAELISKATSLNLL